MNGVKETRFRCLVSVRRDTVCDVQHEEAWRDVFESLRAARDDLAELEQRVAILAREQGGTLDEIAVGLGITRPGLAKRLKRRGRS